MNESETDEVRALCEAVAKARGWTLFESKETKWMLPDGSLTNVFWKRLDGEFAVLPDFTNDEWTGRLLGELAKALPDLGTLEIGHDLAYDPDQPERFWVGDNDGGPTLGIAVCRAYIASLEGTR